MRRQSLLKKAVDVRSQIKQRLRYRIREIVYNFIKSIVQDIVYTETWVWGDRSKISIAPTARMNNAMFNTSSGNITIGDYTFAGHNVAIVTGTHNYKKILYERQTCIPRQGNNISIGKGVWVGSNATILGPCSIGDHAVIAAGAVVTPRMDVPAGAIVVGAPARIVKYISSEYFPKNTQEKL